MPADSEQEVDFALPPDLEIIEPLCAVFRRSLKDEGLKYTPERAAILDAIIQMDGLFDAEQLQDRLKDQSHRVSKATVYRTIKLLQDAGILQRVVFDQDQARYQLVYGAKPNDLLIRVDSDEVLALDLPELIELRNRICAELGLEPTGHRLHIFARQRPNS